ncbi:hypothetical protein P4909_08365 [Escherichia coli]
MTTPFNGTKFPLSPLACLVAFSLLPCAYSAMAAEEAVEFDNTFLMGGRCQKISTSIATVMATPHCRAVTT